MRFIKQGSQDNDKLQLRMAPMIDVVFLLLIFFMCVSKWKQAEGNLSAELPVAGAENPAAPPPVDLEQIVIKLRKSARGVDILMTNNPCSDFDVLYNRLATLRQQVDVPVIIDCSRDVSFQDAVSALNAVVKANFKDVSFAAPDFRQLQIR